MPLRRACALLLALSLAGVTWLATSPAPPQVADTGWDKANHLLAFALLALLADGAFGPAGRARLASAVGLALYGAAIEALQSQLPPRSAEWADWLADLLGIAAGLALAVGARRLSR